MKAVQSISCFVTMALGLIATSSSNAAESTARVTAEKLEGRIRVSIGREPFAEYVYQGYAKPIVYPIYGPGQISMTRNYPLRKDVPGEPMDHPHHKSLWLAHGEVNGEDFWAEKGRIVHERIVSLENDPGRVLITADNRWLGKDGKTVCTDTTRVGFQELPGGARAIDYDVTIHASHGPVTFGDTKEGFMAVRVHPALQLKGDPKRGVIARGQAVNSEGDTNNQAWGKRAAWVDYHGKIDDQMMGLAMFDHPANLRHPTCWHARDYGLVAANPFGARAFTANKESDGALTIAKGEDLQCRFRIVLHQGDAQEAGIAKLYEDYRQ